MKNPRSVKELVSSSTVLGELRAKLRERSTLLEHVRAALAPDLAEALQSAGIVNGQLTLGVASSAWAARMRYECGALRTRLTGLLPTAITSVRVKVVHTALKT